MNKWIVRTAALVVLVGVAALWTAIEFVPCPSLNDDLSFSKRILDRNGKLMRLSLAYDGKYRVRTLSKELPQGLINSVLLHEDQRYFRHNGISVGSVVRAAVLRLCRQSRSGASTITMQLARIRFGIDSSTFAGKLTQAFRALQLERRYSKTQLLVSYLNRVSMGGNIEGVGAASLIYFGRPPSELTQEECDALALIPQRPARRTPIDSKEADDLFKARITLASTREGRLAELAPLLFKRNLPLIAPHFSIQAERQNAAEKLNTTFDSELQLLVETEIGNYLGLVRQTGVRNASAILVDYKTGEVLSYVGSAGFSDSSICGQIDGVRASRSPGSTLKPFIYTLAFQEGLVHPGSLIADDATAFGGYQPQNFDKKFMGKIPVRDALIRSRNIPAILLAGRLMNSTRARLISWTGAEEQNPGLGFAIGGMGMSMEKLAKLWCALARRGSAINLKYSIDGKKESVEHWFSPEAAFLTLSILGSRENLLNEDSRSTAPVAWKTGTSQGFRDAWCCAVFDRFVLCVWLGSFSGEGNPALIGREIAAPLLFRIVRQIRRSEPEDPNWLVTASSSNVTRVAVCNKTGEVAGSECRATHEEWFLPGISPCLVCSEGSPAKNKLKIESPLLVVSYVAEKGGGISERGIALRASGATSRCYWFNGESLLGVAENSDTLWWKPNPGTYQITVIDESGNAESRAVQVRRL